MSKWVLILIMVSLLIPISSCAQTPEIPSHVIQGKLVNLSGHYISIEIKGGSIEHYAVVSWLSTKELIIGNEYYFTYSAEHRSIIKYEPTSPSPTPLRDKEEDDG
jgi:hypothetical protein